MVAREGLIILGFIIVFIVGLFFPSSGIYIIAMLGYPIYLIGRFVAWAIKTLRSGQNFSHEEKTELESIAELTKQGDIEGATNRLHDLTERIKTKYGNADNRVLLCKKLYIQGIVHKIYGQGAECMNKGEYANTVELLKQAQDMMLKCPELFGIDKQLLGGGSREGLS